MAFVKLDTKILNSTLWMDGDACKAFITALLMAEPFEAREPLGTINTYNTEPADFIVPAGWYGFVPAAGPGIVRQALLEQEPGMAALERMAGPDPGSRTADHEGRRMVRINGGYLILNYMTYRDKDHTLAERQARFRLRQKMKKETQSNGVTVTPVTHADADADTSKATAKERAAPSAKRGCRLPPEWTPDAGCIGLAESMSINWRTELDKFRDYWNAKAGSDAVKLDWNATWRNWIRNAKPSNGVNGHATHKPSAVERARTAAIDGELRDRAKRHDDAHALGPDDGVLRPQMVIGIRGED